jgi:hypothetical protein
MFEGATTVLLHVGDSLQLQELLETPLCVEATPTGLLDAAVRQQWFIAGIRSALALIVGYRRVNVNLLHTHTIDVHRTRIDLPGNLQASSEVLREDSTAKTILFDQQR